MERYTAEKALKASMAALNGPRLELCLETHYARIREAAENGERWCRFDPGAGIDSAFFKLVKSCLVKDGYKVTRRRMPRQDPDDTAYDCESCYLISW